MATTGHESELIDVQGLKAAQQDYKSRYDTLITLNAAPTGSTLIYTHNSKTYSFKEGDEVRVVDANAASGYKFYKLHKLVTESNVTTATWVEVGGGGGQINFDDFFGKIRVNLEEYVNDVQASGNVLSGITVTEQNITENTSAATKQWAGQTLSFDYLIPKRDYRISVQPKISYKLDYSYQDVLSLGYGANILKTFRYECYELTVDITSNLDSPDSLDINVSRESDGAYVVVSYDYQGETVTSGNLHNGDTMKIPIDLDISEISFTAYEITDYVCDCSVDLVNKKINVAYASRYATGFIVIDNISDTPEVKIIDESGRNYTTGYSRPAVITAIRNNSHCYVQQSFSNNVLSIKQLDDNNATKYEDGTSASSDIKTKNVFMRLPIFYTKVTTPETDKVKIEFYLDLMQTDQPSESGWKQWGGNLIGRYKGEYKSSKISSLSNSALDIDDYKYAQTPVTLLNGAKAQGSKFSAITWQDYCIMTILGWAYYGRVYINDFIGGGYVIEAEQRYNTGLYDSLGMADTTYAQSNQNGRRSLFWGLEDWNIGKGEILSNIQYKTSNTVTVTNLDSTTRTVSTITNTSEVFVKKLVLGDNLDILVYSNFSARASGYDKGFCLSQTMYSQYLKKTYSFYLGYQGSNEQNRSALTRLAYNGTVEIV